MPPVDPAQTATPPMVVLARHAAPPLRFRGALVSGHAREVPLLGRMEVMLYRRHDGRFVVAHSVMAGGALAATALRRTALIDAIRAVELFCATLPGARLASPAGDDPRRWLDSRRAEAVFAQLFPPLAGAALARWDALARAETPPILETCP